MRGTRDARAAEEPRHAHAPVRSLNGAMRTRGTLALALAAALLAAAGLAAARSGGAAADDGASLPDDWVSVRVWTGLPAPGADGGGGRSLEARGYRQLPVPAGVTPEAYSAWLRGRPGILSAHPAAPVRAAAVPDDAFYASQQAYLEAIGAPAGWDVMTDAGDIVVAVIDTGIDVEHEDLRDNLWVNEADPIGNGVDDDGNGCIDDRHGCRFINLTRERFRGCGYRTGDPVGDVRDDHGDRNDAGSHGTSVAGIIGARGNNGAGVTGVAWNVRIMALKTLDCGPRGSPTGNLPNVARAIDYARRMGAHVINLSLASEPGNPADDLPVVREAIEAAQRDGVVIVAAAGNYGDRGAGYPAAYARYPNVIGVGASDSAAGNGWMRGSSWGAGVDLAAPGVGIVSTIRSDLGLAAPIGRQPAGTSLAAPFVSGLFALLMARNPELELDEYLAIARESAAPPPPAPHGGNWAGAGVIDVAAALARVPMTVRGEALRDWLDPPPGARVLARVDGADCGAGEIGAGPGGGAVYAVRVAAEGEAAGCGAIGRRVELSVDGAAARPFDWGGPNESLALEGHALEGRSPPPGPEVAQELGAGWSLAAYLGPDAPLPEAAAGLPDDWTAVAVWDAEAEGGGAVRHFLREAPAWARTLEGLERFDVFWVRSAGGVYTSPAPSSTPPRQLELTPGWNPFVYTGPARPVADALASIRGAYDQVLSYDNAAGAWRSWLPDAPRRFNGFGGLFPYGVYWVHLTRPAVLLLD